MGIDNVNDVSPRVQYVASAAQTQFDYTFPIFDEADLVVDIDETVQTLTSQYTVSGEGNDAGGTVTLVRDPGEELVGGEVVTIYRDTAIQRTSDFQQNGPFSSSAHNDELDRITIILQELEARIERAIRFPLNSLTTASQALISPVSNFLNKFLFIDGNGVLQAAAALDSVVTLSAQVVGQLLNPQSDSEALQGLTIVDYTAKPGNPIRYGADIDGVNDSSSAFQGAADSEYLMSVDVGNYRLDSTITITIPKIIEFAGRQGIRTFYRQTIGGSPYDEIRIGEQARIMISNNINVFDIQCEQVYIFGGCFDLTGTTDYTKAVFYYPIVNNGDLTGGDNYGGWAGECRDFMVLGNYQDVGQTGIGGYAIHLDTENAPYNWAYLYLHRWRGVVYGMDKGFYCTARPAGKNISINNLHVELQCNSTRQMFYNRGSSTNWISGLHQARNVWQDEDDINQWASIDSNGFCNIDVEFADFGKNPVNGLYTNQKTYNLTGRCVFKQLNRIDEAAAIRIVHKDVDSPIYTPKGVLPRYKSSHGLGERGLFNPCTDDVLGPWVWAAENTSGQSVTIARYQGVADSDTAVSDCVFANQSGNDVDITSALGAIPAMDVGAIFTLSDHSNDSNNASYKVLAAVTDGYNCEKLPDIWPNGYVIDPVDAGAEAVTITTGIGAVVEDSVTAGISGSTDITLANSTNFFNPDGNAPAMTWNAQAITDQDYVEIHVSGSSIQLSKLFIYLGNIEDVQNEYIQVFRYTSAVVDHELIPVSALSETLDSATRYFEVDLGGTSLTNLVIRFIGSTVAGQLMALHGIYAGHTFFERQQQWIQRRRPGTMYGSMFFQAGGIGHRTVTTANLNAASHEVNTSDDKRAGFQVFDTTANIPMYATGSDATSTWVGEKAGSTITLTPS